MATVAQTEGSIRGVPWHLGRLWRRRDRLWLVTEEEAARLVGSVEAARAVGVDRTTLARWVAAGKVEPTLTTAGGHHRYDLDQLRRQLAALRDQRRSPDEE